MQYIVFILSAVAGYFIAHTISGDYEGDKLQRSLRFEIGEYYVHIHHWLCSLILITTLFALRVSSVWLYGLLGGVFLQGIQYRDRFVIVYEKKRFEEIYSKYQD